MIRPLSVFLVASALLAAQARFDVATVRRADPASEVRPDIIVRGATVLVRRTSLAGCLAWAFDLKQYQIVAPSWVAQEKYEIQAKAPEGTPVAGMRRMMQELLNERMGLASHAERKSMPAFVMTVGKDGPKLKESGTGGDLDMSGKGNAAVFKNAKLGTFAELLARQLRVPVLDQTGLDGKYDFTLDVDAYVEANHTKNDELDVLPMVIEKQLGLKLERRKVDLEVLVVDHVEQNPKQN